MTTLFPFADVVRWHLAHHPALQPQDLGKLAYQSEFGPEHLLHDPQAVLPALLAEWRALPKHGDSTAAVEPLGGGLCRFPLARLPDEATCRTLAALFFRAASAAHGTPAGMARRLDLLQALASPALPALPDWLTAYRASGCPPLHHSEVYRRTYKPHYRLLAQDDLPLLCAASAAGWDLPWP